MEGMACATQLCASLLLKLAPVYVEAEEEVLVEEEERSATAGLMMQGRR